MGVTLKKSSMPSQLETFKFRSRVTVAWQEMDLTDIDAKKNIT
jgi:hypothetical protein